MARQPFFDEAADQSLVKADIVAKYFDAWAGIIERQRRGRQNDRLAYIDLYAGPGRYRDGSDSTPLLVLRRAVDNPELRRRLVTLFNDKDEDNVAALQTAISAVPGIDSLTHRPVVHASAVDDEMAEDLTSTSLVPTFAFIDPFGYKGLSRKLVWALVKDWGSDCLFFFNYNRINMGITNPWVGVHMDALFGAELARHLRLRLPELEPPEREAEVVETLCAALKEKGAEFVLPFRFRRSDGRASHHLVFVSKHVLGYSIMKEIMARMSSDATQGVPSFEYFPAHNATGLLFDLSRPLDDLGEMLLSRFAGRAIPMNTVYESHHVGRPFIKKNYKDCLIALEATHKIGATPPAEQRRKIKGRVTFADHVVAAFPPR